MSAYSIAIEKLKSSGLEHLGLDQLHMRALTAEQTAAIGPHFAACPALRIDYMDPFTERAPAQPLRHKAMYPPFFRIRYLGPNLPVDKKGKAIRYMQPGGIGVCAYFPPNIDWSSVLADTNKTIYVTEGELKAAKACDMGFPTIGLGGVNNIYSHKTGYSFLPELERVDWVAREVVICFDNDVLTKPNVISGLNALGRELEQRGALPYVVNLPDPPNGGKMGLDDFFLSHSAADFEGLCSNKESLTLAEELWRMNTLAVKVRTPNCVVDMRDMETLNLETFAAHYNNITTPQRSVMASGKVSYKPVPVATAWLKWPLRTSVRGLTYQPGMPRFIDDGELFNVWGGWGSEPKKGDVQPFLQLLDYIFGKSAEGREAKQWFLQWCSYPIKNPGAKLYTAVLLWSREHGVGKTLLGYVLGRIYGRRNWAEVRQKSLLSDFNSWSKNKQLIIGTEITGSDKNQHADELKDLITSESLTINEKFIPEYTLPNVANFFLNSNRDSALYLEDDDRRFFVWEVQQKAPQEFFEAFDKWYKTHENIQAVHHYLLGVDTSSFKPYAKALTTSAKLEMTRTAYSDHARWCHQLKDSPDYYLRSGSVQLLPDLYTAEELLNLYKATDQFSSVKANTFGVALKAAGFKQLPQTRWGEPSRNSRFFIVRNEAQWLKATPKQIKAHAEATKGRK